MYAAVKELKSFARRGDVIIDNEVFQLHRKFTFLLLIFFCVVVTTNIFFGQTINCFTSVKDDIPEAVINSYCWVKSTYSLPAAMNKAVGTEVAYPGVDTFPGPQSEEPTVYHSYYQWVGFFLLFEALLFYTPYYIWQWIEGGRIKRLVMATELKKPIGGDQAVIDKNISKLASYLRNTRHRYWRIAMGFSLCEVLNFANVVGQIYFVNTFLGGEFTTFGLDVIKFSQMDQANRTDPMIAVFPRVTKCGLNRVGVAGSIQRHDALCVLPMNMVNEKIFVFLWFWFVILGVLSGLALVYRLLMLIPPIRNQNFQFCFPNIDRDKDTGPEDPRDVQKPLIRDTTGKQRPEKLETTYTKWFVLNLVRTNVSSIHFVDLVQELIRLKETKKDDSEKKTPNGT